MQLLMGNLLARRPGQCARSGRTIVCAVAMLFLVSCGASSRTVQSATPTPSGSNVTPPTGTVTPTPNQPGLTPTAKTNHSTVTPTATRPFIPTATAVVDWTTLEHLPLHLPTAPAGGTCPVTAAQTHVSPDYAYTFGSGPVYMAAQIPSTTVLFNTAGPLDSGSPWEIAKINWDISATYHGPILIRGQQIDGQHALEFNGGLGQTSGNANGTEPLLTELRFYGNGQWSAAVVFFRIQFSGCYAVQIDGATFSNSIVFQATAS